MCVCVFVKKMREWIVPASHVCFLTIVVSLRDRVQLYRVLRLRFIHNVCLSIYSLFVFLWMLTKLKRGRFDRAHLQCTRRRGAVLVSFQICRVVRYDFARRALQAYQQPAPVPPRHRSADHDSQHKRWCTYALYDAGTTLNAFVHFFMYAFYADPVNLRFLKKFITSIQILQHGVVVSLLCFTLCMQSCDAPLEIYGFSLLCYGVYLGLFFISTRRGIQARRRLASCGRSGRKRRRRSRLASARS